MQFFAAAVSAAPEEPLISPAPREIAWSGDSLVLSGARIQAAAPAEQQVARLLAGELQRQHQAALAVASDPSPPAPSIRLVLEDSPGAAAILKTLAGKDRWPPPRNADEGYLLEIDSAGAVVFARSPRGLVYGCQTLLQLVTGKPDAAAGKHLPGVRIADYPQLPFRGVHICIFPNTELAAVRKMILLAARFKYNAVVIEFWSSLKSKKRPETAYENTYAPEQIRSLVLLGQALGMEMIPMLNSWGHASGMRSRSGEHAVLDRFPEHKDLYEANGWSFDLTNPAIYDHLFDRFDELLEIFAPAKYFHIGLDEAWGHLGVTEKLGEEPHRLISQHIGKLYGYFSQRNVRILLWHDMFLERDHPQLGRQSPANSIPPFNTHLALPDLPRDVIIAAWNYSNQVDWAVPEYFHEKGFPVVVCPWKSKGNTMALVNIAKKSDLLGLLETTWDSLEVCQPSVGRAGVLAWTAPGYDLAEVPFEHWLQAIRAFPICDLPRLETTLNPEKSN